MWLDVVVPEGVGTSQGQIYSGRILTKFKSSGKHLNVGNHQCVAVDFLCNNCVMNYLGSAANKHSRGNFNGW